MSSRSVTLLSFAARRQVVEQMVPFYREASLLRKRSCWIKVDTAGEPWREGAY